MSEPAISVRGLSKWYRLGVISRHTLIEEAQCLWHRLRRRNPQEHMGPLGRNRSGTGPRAAQIDPKTNLFWALRDVNFEVQPGEVLGIVGANGAGKSTLLKILSRITEPAQGEAFINGRVASLLEVGTGFHPELTGRENVYMNGTLLGMKRLEVTRKLNDIVEFAELMEFIDTPVKRYSSGMYVRLAFAVAAHLDPEILFIDEVLAVGDMSFQRKCLGKIEDIAGTGRTVLFVSHNMSAVNRLCSRVLMIDGGRLACDGSAHDVTTAYLESMSAAPGGRDWHPEEAPRSDNFVLLSVRLVGETGARVKTVAVDTETKLQIRYRTLQPGMAFRCLVRFFAGGTTAFTAVEPRESVRPEAGDYVSSVRIPAHLLAEGDVSVHVHIFYSAGWKMHHVRVKDVLQFQVYDPIDGGSARGDYAGNMAGAVMPRLEWSLTKDSS